MMEVSRRWWISILTIALLLIAAVALNCARSAFDPAWSNEKIQESKARGDKIVAALHEYKKDNGSFPESLDLLKPKYLAAVPVPAAGRMTWQYINGDTEFALYFAKGNASEDEWHYTTQMARWTMVEKGF